jgi:hypothetical protein
LAGSSLKEPVVGSYFRIAFAVFLLQGSLNEMKEPFHDALSQVFVA